MAKRYELADEAWIADLFTESHGRGRVAWATASPNQAYPDYLFWPKCRPRNIIERMFGWQKENQRIDTRFDKLAKSYAARISLVRSLFATSLFVQRLGASDLRPQG
ncbi:transposase [Pseudomonas aeruginosa]|nr:transposase [Pseudomonas aeruginosa]MBH8788154.1 transposase [Pseudomonas aeruginosa]HBO4549580.1 transposase [Pseudomonas aeruginosa]HBO4811794.1 transposase [Pseudomonas aeruginosa]HCE9704558.1 transposase [Pseudomonas aeruginosa]